MLVTSLIRALSVNYIEEAGMPGTPHRQPIYLSYGLGPSWDLSRGHDLLVIVGPSAFTTSVGIPFR